MSEVSREDPARFNMVQQQIRPWGVVDDRVLDVMAEIPRELFVPDAYLGLAYADIEVPLTSGRAMLAPKIVARMLQSLKVRPGDRALEIGTGSGYLTACLARLGARVLSLETDAALIALARERLARLAVPAVELRRVEDLLAPGADGPFDIVTVNGAVPSATMLGAWRAQLTLSGRLFAIVGAPPVTPAMLITRAGGADYRRQILFETGASVPALVSEAPAFVF